MYSTLPIAVVSIIIKNEKILLLKRKNTPWMNWYWWLPWWRLDLWESMIKWAIRELKEEIWINVLDLDISYKSIIQHKNNRWERIYFIIKVDKFFWEVKNMEKDKCEEVKWFSLNNLPKNITPQVQICLENVINNIYYSEYWY